MEMMAGKQQAFTWSCMSYTYSQGGRQHQMQTVQDTLSTLCACLCREHLRRAASNLPYIDVLPTVGANVYSILQKDNLFLSRDAVEGLVNRLQLDRTKEQQLQEAA